MLISFIVLYCHLAKEKERKSQPVEGENMRYDIMCWILLCDCFEVCGLHVHH